MTVIDVNESSFQSEVIERSHDVPVLVDFWAPWCGPCRMLGPVLERLANEPNSNFILAKLNTDQNQGLSMRYQVRGIPAVKAFRNGQVVDEFVGAQPEPMVRQFIQKVTAGAAPQRPQPAQKQATPPADPAERLQRARDLLKQGKGCDAERLLTNFPACAQSSEAGRLLPLAQFMCQPAGEANATIAGLKQQAVSALARRDYSAALYNLLAAHNQGADKAQTRQIMEGVFTLLGENDTVAAQYRALLI